MQEMIVTGFDVIPVKVEKNNTVYELFLPRAHLLGVENDEVVVATTLLKPAREFSRAIDVLYASFEEGMVPGAIVDATEMRTKPLRRWRPDPDEPRRKGFVCGHSVIYSAVERAMVEIVAVVVQEDTGSRTIHCRTKWNEPLPNDMEPVEEIHKAWLALVEKYQMDSAVFVDVRNGFYVLDEPREDEKKEALIHAIGKLASHWGAGA